ncbi:adenylate cyclase type 9 isoform X1 [Halyomorpha halys]|uniref:adenylate cyclase type 9 isoform X1 n=1 Tax=Halyomorpha halys TaxID=286706 RepID=UPI0006D4F736|nr:adenylate cyclase type 9 isoform X1 [Halyomorpha halys]
MSDKIPKNDYNSNGERRATQVSFSRNKDEISIQDDSEDEITLAPYIQTYLAHSGNQFGCCGICFPVPFERASNKSWWDPKFDSEILEKQYRNSSFAQIRLRFRYSLVYMLILSIIWCLQLITFGILDKSQKDASPLGVIFFLFAVFCSIVLIITHSSLYRRYILPVSFVVSLVMCLLSIASVSQSPVLSPASDFAICIEIIMIIYTVIPLPLYLCVLMGGLYSVLFEILGTGYALPIRIVSHICVHLIALHILIMTNVRMRGTFMKVGQSLLVRRELEIEKELKEKMIHSVMPPSYANWLKEKEKEERHKKVKEEREKRERKNRGHSNSSCDANRDPVDVIDLFRPFNVNCMKDVSILFADIVGFTRMSSKKTASELVSVLNVLFERFDRLCTENFCEKIATLGDCYYCVSGCPTANPRHAHCCVEMGLGMIKAIAEFDREKEEDVNMRVGVHTGTVLCGIVGRRRFKFDVWSNDVALANKMESTGKPGRVHISQTTRSFLDETYILELGDVVQGLETYFIVAPKEQVPSQIGSTQLTVTSPTQTMPSDQSGNFPSFETALASQLQSESLTTAHSHQKSNNVNCTISPFDHLKDSDLFKDENSSQGCTALSTPSSPTPLTLPGLLSERLNAVKATSLPNVFAREMQVCRSRTSLVVNPSPKCKYSRLKIISLKTAEELGNGKSEPPFGSSLKRSPPSPLKIPVHLDVPKDDLSFCQSLNSRKDSGIRSNSRRSSIQQQLFSMNGLTTNELMNHRVSGYYTSSQFSLNELEKGKGPKLPTPIGDSFGACFQKLRKQSDLQLIKCVQVNSQSESSYFVSPPLRRWTLLFKDPDLECQYRRNAHRTTSGGVTRSKTLATARFNTYFDITISLIVFTSVALSLFLFFPFSVSWISVLSVLLFIQLFIIFLCIRSAVKPLFKCLHHCMYWYRWHCIGGALVSLPLIALLTNFPQSVESGESIFNYTYLLFVAIIHYCNFTQLNCWMKSFLATIGSVIYLILITITILQNPSILDSKNQLILSEIHNNSEFLPDSKPQFNLPQIDDPTTNSREKRFGDVTFLTDLDYLSENEDFLSSPCTNCFNDSDPDRNKRFVLDRNSTVKYVNLTDFTDNNNLLYSEAFLIEIYIDIFLLILLVWFLNREFEISYRLSFHGNEVAANDQKKVAEMKDLSDWLLNNIIPGYVAEHLKSTTKGYSEDVKDAGILFASIVNFSELYDESFMEGRECLRVLNELVSDFDELLSQPRFNMVEKIKTIGSTFMAASGLNPSQRRSDSNEHLFQLMEFAFALQAAIKNFNAHLLEFNLILRVGFNFGDVTAGVIGTTKLHYDIWGDAVNIASRMDTTGVPNRIQVSAACVQVLSACYNFERRGTVYVKGKDNMDVYLVVGRKEELDISDPKES